MPPGDYRGRSEPHLNSTLQSELGLSVAEGTGEAARLPARREGRSYPRSQQPIHEISGLREVRSLNGAKAGQFFSARGFDHT